MKTSSILVSALFGAIAAAAPFDKRALVTKTEVVTETVVIYTTVYGDEAPVAPATTTPGLFFERPKSSKVVASSTSVYTPPVVAPVPSSAAPAPAPSSVYTPPPAPSSVYTPPVVEVPSAAPAPPQPTVINTPAPQPTPPAPVPVPEPAPSVAPAPQPAPPSGNTVGQKYHGDITVYDNNGAAGACGHNQYDSDMIVALAAPTMGDSTYDVQTGAATNAWCGQKITIQYGGKTVEATIQDKCPVCKAGDIDLSRAVWKALGITEDTRLQGDWWKSS